MKELILSILLFSPHDGPSTSFSFILFCLFIIFFTIYILRKQIKKEHHSNWNQLLDGFQFSTKEFYDLVAIKLQENGIKKMSFETVNLKTGSVLSTRRLYFRVKWQEYQYDLCFAPFGKGCFVSWWLVYSTSVGEVILSKIPFFGELLRRAFYKKTYYQIDTASMFMAYAQSSVLEVIDKITKDSGIRLTEDQRKPKLNDIFKR